MQGSAMAKSTLGSLRATLADERSRLGNVLAQIDEALDCLEPVALKAGAVREKAVGQESRHRPAREGTEPSLPLAAWGPPPEEVPQTGISSDQLVDAKASAANGARPRSLGESLADSRQARPMQRAAGSVFGVRRVVSDFSTAADATWRQQRREDKSQVNRREIFADADQMKEQVQRAILEPDYNVRSMYKEDGCWQAVARSSVFDITSLFVILLNAVWLAVETDYNDEPLLVNADPPFIIVENLFCAYFVSELFIRFMAFKVKADVMKDSWFVFDSVIVFFMAFETWFLSLLVWMTAGALTANSSSTSVLRVIRLFRMTRAARVARLLKAVPELMVIGRGIVIVARTVAVIMCLLVMIVYTFAIVFTQLAKGTNLENTICSDMLTTMSTLLLGGIFPDFKPTTDDMAAEDFFFAVFFFMFVLLAYATIMNMLIGVLVEVVSVVASVEKETNQVASVKRVLQRWTPGGDEDGDGLIDVNEFKSMLKKDCCAKDLHDVGVDAVALVDHADFIYRDRDSLTFSEVLTVVLGLRGRNDTKVQDLVQMRKFLHGEFQRIETSLESLQLNMLRPCGTESLSQLSRHC